MSRTDRQTIASLICQWQDAPDAPGTELESKLHDVLKARHLGTIFNFYGLAVWVDEHTPAGKVRRAEMLEPDDFPA